MGISEYKEPRIRPLAVAHRDATEIAQTMKTYGQLDEIILLTDRDATLANLRNVIVHRLPAKTQNGDFVILYWSGHGGRIASAYGHEVDGYDEFLVTHDGRLTSPSTIRKTMLLDETLGQWLRKLAGRNVVVILDACHSGGQVFGAIKSTDSTLGPPTSGFFAGVLGDRTKDIDQVGAAVLASSRATQVSFERRTGDLSVMTYFLMERISRGSGPVTLFDAVKYVFDNVPRFVEHNFPGTTQTPVFVDRIGELIYLRPTR